jgi:hypothetical protein
MQTLLIVLAALISIGSIKYSGPFEDADELGGYQRLEHTVQRRYAALDVAER